MAIAILYEDFLVQFRESLQQQSDTYLDQFDEHFAFDYLTAELFATTSPDQFVFTDGARDGGIDFFIRNSPDYEIYQCKCPDLSGLKSEGGALSFADDGLNELLTGIRFLQSKDGKVDFKSDIKKLRAQYQQDLADSPDACSLTATLAIAGKLTPAAREKFDAARRDLSQQGVKLRLLEWKDIAKQLRSPDDVATNVAIDLKVSDPKSELLTYRDFCYFLADAFDFYKAFQDYEWQLFDWNVRLQIHNSPINRKIVQSLISDKTRKKFHHLNNGILIACQSYAVREREQVLRINAAQIINGCQTVRAICDAYDEMDPRQQAAFRENTKVQVKVIQGVDQDFISELSVTTNNQNPMNARNLKSNFGEQKELQKLFRELPEKWFYERKEGEFKSLLTASTKIKWFRKSDYLGQGNKARLISNELLAKVWNAYIGNSDKALFGGIEYFEDTKIYSRIFSASPGPSFWEKFRQPNLIAIVDEDFESHPPNPYQFLLAFTIGKFVDVQKIPSVRNKEKAIERGIREGVLKANPTTGQLTDSKENVDQFLSKDEDYKLNIMLANMREVLVELIAFLLVRKYKALSSETSRDILLGSDLKDFAISGFDPSRAPSLEHKSDSIAGPCYAFIRDCVKQYRIANRAEIEAAPRMKTYLAQRATVTKLRDFLILQDNYIKDLRVPWKTEGSTFLESLPFLKS